MPHRFVHRDTVRGTRRHGFTLTELLACLAIMAVLLGLLLPAVQKIRSTMQRTACLNNVRQLGIATHAFEQTRGVLPLSSCLGLAPPPRIVCFSAQAELLPYLDVDTLAREVDWSDESADFPGSPPSANSANRKLLAHKVPVLLCPADALAREGMNSYRLSIGWGLLLGGNDPLPRRFAGFGDGLSNTALFSERLVGGGSQNQRRNALIVNCGDPSNIGPACVQVQLPPAPATAEDPFMGATWLRGADRHVRYAHLFPPNSRLQDCQVGGWTGFGLMTARSGHTGGVNVLFADGHALFVGDAVDLKVWRAWGTPNGGEITP